MYRVRASDRRRLTFMSAAVVLWLLQHQAGLSRADAADESTEDFSLVPNDAAATDVVFDLRVSGDMITPSPEGPRKHALHSTARFEFQNHSFPTELGGPFTLRAVRKFAKAVTQTTVGEDHHTKNALAGVYRLIHVFGSDQGLQAVSPKFALPRKQLDLLQMPFDVLAAGALLPTARIRSGDKWNVDSWVLPMLTGIEAVAEQSSTCTLKSVDAEEAVVEFSGAIEGAVLGSVSEISVAGVLRFSRSSRIIRSMEVTQKEKRSPGPVSPGLDVTAHIKWTQVVSSSEDSVEPPAEATPAPHQLQLSLQTPLKLVLRHSREWHMFHETPQVMMLRQLRDGEFIGQCNISSAVTVPPKQHTPDEEFLADVRAAVKQRKGRVVKESTIREDGEWRIRRIQAAGNAGGEVILWDYYLCSAATGEQYSIVFSHSQDDDDEFANSAEAMLSGLRIARRRPALPFR